MLDRDLDRRLVRLEGKISMVAFAASWLLCIAVGAAIYSLIPEKELAMYFGVGAGIAAGGWFDWQMRRLDKRFPLYPSD